MTNIRHCGHTWLILLLTILLLPGLSARTQAEDGIKAHKTPPQRVRVGVYPFAPFAEQDDQGQLRGMAQRLITILNQHQQQLTFEAVPVSPKRRYQAYLNQDVDAFLYENMKWGWARRNIDIRASQPYQSGGELYIAKAAPGRDQRFFEQLQQRHLVGILGYHYGFAGYNSDETFLRDNYQITLTWDNQKVLDLLQQGRGEVALMSEAYWQQFAQQNPAKASQFLVSEKYDQYYSHSILIRPQLLGQHQLDSLVREITRRRDFRQLIQDYGISPHQ